jgi:hypothetical protein
MTSDEFERLLYESEGDSIDFKREQYPIDNVTDDVKSELVKDILAFANSFRRADAFIVLGVDNGHAFPRTVTGINCHHDDAKFQQIVNGKTNRQVNFSYETLRWEATAHDVRIVINVPPNDVCYFVDEEDFPPTPTQSGGPRMPFIRPLRQKSSISVFKKESRFTIIAKMDKVQPGTFAINEDRVWVGASDQTTVTLSAQMSVDNLSSPLLQTIELFIKNEIVGEISDDDFYAEDEANRD